MLNTLWTAKCSPHFNCLQSSAGIDLRLEATALLHVLGQSPAPLLGYFWRKDVAPSTAAADAWQDHYPAFFCSFLKHLGLLAMRKRAWTEDVALIYEKYDCPCSLFSDVSSHIPVKWLTEILRYTSRLSLVHKVSFWATFCSVLPSTEESQTCAKAAIQGYACIMWNDSESCFISDL